MPGLLRPDETPVELISKITELNDISDGMADENLDEVLAFVIKLIMKDTPPAHTIPPAIAKLQAIGAVMSLKANYYTNWSKGQTSKKNVYYTAAKEIDKLVAALKYLARGE